MRQGVFDLVPYLGAHILVFDLRHRLFQEGADQQTPRRSPISKAFAVWRLSEPLAPSRTVILP